MFSYPATFVSSLADLEGEEKFDASFLGTAEEVVQERISDDECILVKGTKLHSCASIILRGANDHMLDEQERSVHDSLCVIKRTLESNFVVPGGGAVETALSIYLENFATTLVNRKPLVHRTRMLIKVRVHANNSQLLNLQMRSL